MKRPSQWSLGGRIFALCLPFIALLALIAVGGAITANHNSRQLDSLLGEVGVLRTDTQQLEVQMLNQETGIRGYAVGGTPADLQPYTDGLVAQRALIDDLRAHAANRPKIRQDIDDVSEAVAAWQTAVADPVINAVDSGDRTAALGLINATSRDEFDSVRTRLATLETDVGAVRDVSAATLQNSSREIVSALIASIAVLIVAGFVFAVLLRRMVRNPVARLAADVRQVASGDYNHTVDGSGPPEVATLGADVEEMRQRIVADLRVVQNANDAVERANADLAQANSWLEAANTQLESQAADLQRSNQDLEQFAYVASHDLQEPLRKVASFCQLLQRRYAGQLDERADQYIAFAVDGAHRMQRLINDLLSFSRIGRLTNDFTEVDLGGAVTAAVNAADDSLARAGATVEAVELPTVRGEESLMVALFSNLLSNSLKFRRADEPVRVRITASRSGDDWEICVRDNGIGIEPEYADKVFVIFQRLHPRDAYPGTGIGLAIAKRIVEHHGGRIWLDTDVSDGTAICFTIRAEPVAAGSPDPAPSTEPAPSTKPAASPEPAVLPEPAGSMEPATSPEPAVLPEPANLPEPEPVAEASDAPADPAVTPPADDSTAQPLDAMQSAS
ncbi:MAG TPA: ATP-binding protein [Micromonosporaceae bacterium]|nr:ATP-binding protein [Micromonosporaceae bacterium]